jgi:hypothetical protein
MSFIFDYDRFENFYLNTTNLVPLEKYISMFVFKRGKTWAFEEDQVIAIATHPYIPYLYIGNTTKYIFFTLAKEVNGKIYSDHFSFGRKDSDFKTNRLLIDTHFTRQNVEKKSSENEDMKCFLYDGKPISVATLKTEFCERPSRRRIIDAYGDKLYHYLLVIIATPFMSREYIQNLVASEIKPYPHEGGASNKKVYHKGKDGRRRLIHFGSRGGAYVLKMHVKVYLKRA